MSAPAKFLFDQDFGHRREAEQSVPKAMLDAAIAEAEARGHARGYAAGKAEAQASAERQLASACDRVGTTLQGLAAELAAAQARIEAEAVAIAFAVARKLAPALIAREPFAEIAALATECFNHLAGAPHVVVRLNDTVYPGAHERIERIARERGFEGRLVVLAEPDIAAGDCRIEWADGGAVRARAEIEAAVAEAVERYISLRRNGASETCGDDDDG